MARRAFSASRICDPIGLKTVSAMMRQAHAAGENLFVDWAGDAVPVLDAVTSMERRAHIFVAVLGPSNYTYAEGRWSEALPEWIGAHVNALTAIGGVPGAVVCDNLNAGVSAMQELLDRGDATIGQDDQPAMILNQVARQTIGECTITSSWYGCPPTRPVERMGALAGC